LSGGGPPSYHFDTPLLVSLFKDFFVLSLRGPLPRNRSLAAAPSDPSVRFRIRSLDGLRALSVLVVFVGHGRTDQGQWPGYVGVTVFFFLSGFLITTLLRKELEQSGRIYLARFYLRRTFRILPAAYFTIAVSLLLAATRVLPDAISGWGVLSEFLNYTNYYIVAAGYESLPPETSQMWSLAVEEQYYLVVPLALLLAYRFGARRIWIGWGLVIVALGIAGWRIFLGVNGADFDRLYFSTDTRIDSILWGAAFALLLNPVMGDAARWAGRFRRWVSQNLAWITIIAVVALAGSAAVPALSFRLSIATTVQCLALIPIFWFVTTRPRGLVGRLLNSRVLVRLGALSFSLYLLHKMVLALIGPLMDAPIVTDLISLLASVLVSQLVFWAVESPATRLRIRIERRFLAPRSTA
jgi:peptidoglycan/LPS O-acetylase OafA/YrhL